MLFSANLSNRKLQSPLICLDRSATVSGLYVSANSLLAKKLDTPTEEAAQLTMARLWQEKSSLVCLSSHCSRLLSYAAIIVEDGSIGVLIRPRSRRNLNMRGKTI